VTQAGYWRTGGRFHPRLQLTSSLVEAPTLSSPLVGVGVPLAGKVTRACLEVIPKSPRMATDVSPLGHGSVIRRTSATTPAQAQ